MPRKTVTSVMPSEYIQERYEYGVDQARTCARSLNEAADGIEAYIEAFKQQPMRTALSDNFTIDEPTHTTYVKMGEVDSLFPSGAH